MLPDAQMKNLSLVDCVVFDFDGVFTDNAVWVSQDGIETVKCCRSDGIGLSRLRNLGVQLLIISTETNPVVSMRAKKLNIDCLQGVDDKGRAIVEACLERGVSLQRTVFVGNDVNDIPAFQKVAFPIAVGDAYPEVDQYVLHKTEKFGGLGAVREICDLIIQAKSEYNC